VEVMLVAQLRYVFLFPKEVVFGEADAIKT
jgi:hypothetical protein